MTKTIEKHGLIREVPDKFFYLNEDGTFHEGIKPDRPLEVSHYWKLQEQKVALVLLVSAGLLTLMLLYETDILNYFWQIFVNVIAGVLGL